MKREKHFNIPLSFLAICYGFALYVVVYPGLGNMLIPAIFYAIIITTMTIFAINMYLNKKDWLSVKGLIGAVLFLISDSVLAINRFLKPIDYVDFLILVPYFLGQIFICASIGPEKQNNQAIH